MSINVTIIEEAGHKSALLGLSLSYYREGQPLSEFWTEDKITKALKRAKLLAPKGGGHNKFLESIQVWAIIKAPRYWWAEFDTYRIGTSRNSASTMHTLNKEPVTLEHFAEGTSEIFIEALNRAIEAKLPLTEIKKNLPEGYLQTRQVNLNYMSLRNIIKQRLHHKLPEWRSFCEQVRNQVEHFELLEDCYE